MLVFNLGSNAAVVTPLAGSVLLTTATLPVLGIRQKLAVAGSLKAFTLLVSEV